MSRAKRGETVNRIAQGSGVVRALNARNRRAIRKLLDQAFRAGEWHARVRIGYALQHRAMSNAPVPTAEALVVVTHGDLADLAATGSSADRWAIVERIRRQASANVGRDGGDR